MNSHPHNPAWQNANFVRRLTPRTELHDEKDHEIAKTNEELAKVAKHGDDPGQLAEALPVLGEAACQKGIAVTKMMP